MSLTIQLNRDDEVEIDFAYRDSKKLSIRVYDRWDNVTVNITPDQAREIAMGLAIYANMAEATEESK